MGRYEARIFACSERGIKKEAAWLSMGVRGTLRDLDRVLLFSASAWTCLFGLDRDLEREEVVDTEDILDEREIKSNRWGADEVDSAEGVGRRGVCTIGGPDEDLAGLLEVLFEVLDVDGRTADVVRDDDD